MYKMLRNFAIGLLILIPVMVAVPQISTVFNQLFKVYSEPTNVIYRTHENGIEIKFRVEKNYECILPSKKGDQDVFASLSFMNEAGDIAVKPADVYPADDVQRPFKNLLIVGLPANVGPYVVEVPDNIMSNLVKVDLNILCKRPYIGFVYATMGPFNVGALASEVAD